MAQNARKKGILSGRMPFLFFRSEVRMDFPHFTIMSAALVVRNHEGYAMNEEKGPRVNRSAVHKDQREAGWLRTVGIN